MRPRPAATPQRENGGRRRRRAALSLVAVTTMGLGVLVAAPAAQAASLTVDIVGINDFHGRIEADDGVGRNTVIGGAVSLAGAVDAVRASNPSTLFVSSGDNIGASTFTSFIQQDEPTIEALNSIGLDVSATGNHEFDQGQDDLDGRVDDLSDFPYVAANIMRGAEHAYDPYVVKTTANGVRVAFIGAVTETMPTLVSPDGIEGLTFTPIVPAVNAAAAEIVAADSADAIVLLVHEGAADATPAAIGGDTAFGRIARGVSPDVSAILSAHTHAQYNTTVVPDGGTVPRPVVQTSSYGAFLSHLTLSVDPAATGAPRDTVTANLLAQQKLFGYPAGPNPGIAKIVADAVAVAEVRGREVIGSIGDSFNRARQSGGVIENRAGESTLGNFVADAQLATTTANGAQLAFMNPGGLRADLTYVGPDGDVTYRAAAAVQPFANTLVVVDMTGDDIRRALEQQWPTSTRTTTLKLGTSANVSYTYDPTAPAGARISTLSIDGTPVDPAAVYKVTVNSFLASGGDGFTAFANGLPHADSGKVDLQSQLDYFAAQPEDEQSQPDFASRSVGVAGLTPAPAAGFAAGDVVSMTLSSLVLSQAAPEATGVVTASLDGVQLASAPIDATNLDSGDEQGTATLTFTVPEGIIAPTAGPVTRSLRLAVAGTGTEVDLPIVFAAAAAPVVVDPTPGDGDPGTPGTPGTGAGAAPGAGPGTGAGTGSSSTPRPAAAGDLAFTGSDAATTGLLAALALMLAGAGVLTATRLRRRRELLAEATD